jgi:predicted HTH transcriptional regulator
MSLWTKRMSDVQFADVDEFCRAGYREGPQLDYKQTIPNDLAKTVAALANTKGGLLLLGVEASTTTNQPSWPCTGMPVDKGLSERITQICRDGIYPPVLPAYR